MIMPQIFVENEHDASSTLSVNVSDY